MSNGSYSIMNVSFLEAPICKGSPTDGSQYAFASLCRHGLADRFNGAQFIPMSLHDVAEPETDPRMKDLNAVMAVSTRLYQSVGKALREGRFPIVIGGDHSVAIGSIAGTASVCGAEALTVIYIDGHTDIHTEKTTETGFIHGMPLAAAMGLCHKALTVGAGVNLYGKNTVILGARSIDDGEYPTLQAQGVTLYTAEEIHARGMAAVLGEVLTALRTPHIHLSFDVDVMDGGVFPSTGYRMPDGLSFEEAEQALTAVLRTGRVISMDFVEYNPLLDVDGHDREAVFRLLSHLKTDIT